MKYLTKLENEVQSLESMLADLNIKLYDAKEAQEKLQEETNIMIRRLIAADKLISGLSSENER